MDETLSNLIDYLKQHVAGLQGVYLFGSFAQGLAMPGSDIDLAVLSDQSLDMLTRLEYQDQLAVIAGREVDLVNIREINLIFQHEIVATGQRIFTADEAACVDFEVDMLMMYIDFNMARQAILNDIYERGYVRGK